ncbi:MAG: T9SS type A sorting domain-containing protein [Bacteroidetes bacterium]|nr:T9SS type A sorting domain-containing protein [Bacteroidota bacterium]MBP6315832.1 T9SS type A sorting domain-containing protein [Chitinophagaceae bacterium]
MKHILWLLLSIFFSVNSFSQNWQTVSITDTTMYEVSASGPNAMWNNYLRTIWVDSSTNIPNGIKNYFYPSVRLDKFENIDTANGGTWLGKFNIRLNNGEEYFFNQYEDTILIKTFSNLNDSWIICSKNGIDYVGTIASLGQQLIDGNLDSTKIITIQAMQAGSPVANYYNSLTITLSKNHGFFDCFELFGFPDKNVPTFDLNVTYPYPYLPLMHKRLDSTYLNTFFWGADLAWKFKPGNEWIYYFEDKWWKDWGYRHDSIKSSQLISPTSIVVSSQKHTFLHTKIFPQQNNPYDTMYHIYEVVVDTINSYSPYSGLYGVLSEHKNQTAPTCFCNNLTRFRWYLLDTFCNNRIVLIDTQKISTLISGNAHHKYRRMSGFIDDTYLDPYHNYYYDNGMSTNYHFHEMIYSKLDSCIEGTKLNFNTLSASNTNVPSSITLYPNPVSQEIFIKNETGYVVHSYKIIDITGKEHSSKPITNPIVVAHLPPGLYMLHLYTNGGILHRRFFKE